MFGLFFFNTTGRGNNRVYDSCTSFTVEAKKPGLTCKVTISYAEKSSSRLLKDTIVISSYR